VYLRVATGQGTNVYYFLNDQLGAPQKLIARNGEVVWSMESEAFGKATISSNSTVTNNLRFSSQYYDDESELHYNTHRYYEPEVGRYVSRDPIADRAYTVAAQKLPFLATEMDRMADPGQIIQAIDTKNWAIAIVVKARLRQKMEWVHQLQGPYSFLANEPTARLDALGLLWLGSYGNYCGPGWCAGRRQPEAMCFCNKSYRSVKPIDDMDRCCEVHDICLGSGGGKECDQRMCSCLGKINPEDLVRPGGPDSSVIWHVYQEMLGLFCNINILSH